MDSSMFIAGFQVKRCIARDRVRHLGQMASRLRPATQFNCNSHEERGPDGAWAAVIGTLEGRGPFLDLMERNLNVIPMRAKAENAQSQIESSPQAGRAGLHAGPPQ